MLKQQALQVPAWNQAVGRRKHPKGEHSVKPLPDLVRFLIVLIVTAALMTSVAAAETLKSTEWGFSVIFPGQSKMSVQPLETKAGKVTMVSYLFENPSQTFMISITDYPKGSVEFSESTFNRGISGFIDSFKGTIRNRAPYKLGNVSGFDFLVDVPPNTEVQKPWVCHVRFFLVGDRFFQITYGGPVGTEQSATALAFLNSFRLLR